MDKRDSIIALALVLLKKTDRDHVLRRSEIEDEIEKTYQIKIHRKMTYDLIHRLNSFPDFKVVYDASRRGYYLESAFFSRAEILFLCNIFHNVPFINQAESNELIRKLKVVMSEPYVKAFNDCIYMPNNRKTTNTDLMKNIDTITRAVAIRKKISFNYQHYSYDKKLHIVNNTPIVIEPRFVIYQDNYPYLVASGTKYEDLGHFRVDKIRDLAITDLDCGYFDFQTDATVYAQRKIYMFAEEDTWVSFKADRSILDYVFETFGTSVNCISIDESTFQFSARMSRISSILFGMRYLDHVTITGPADIRKEFSELLHRRIKEYEE